MATNIQDKIELSVVILNCNSIYKKLAEIKLLIYNIKPSIFCLTETWVSNKYLPIFVGYNSLWKNRQDGYGGTCIAVQSGINYKDITLNPFQNGILEYQCIEVVLDSVSKLRIMNIYNPNRNLIKQEFLHFIMQLGGTYMIVGDFNGHTPLLSSRDIRPNYTGKTIEDVLLQNNICLANKLDFFTYLDRRTGSKSCLDLVFTSPDIISGIELSRMKDIGSDHFPVLVKTQINANFSNRKRMKK